MHINETYTLDIMQGEEWLVRSMPTTSLVLRRNKTGPAHELAIGLILVALAVLAVSDQTMNRPKDYELLWHVQLLQSEPFSPLSTSQIILL